MSNLSIPKSSSDPEMEGSYTKGYQLFETGKYQESAQIFSELALSCPAIKEVWVALAVSQIRAKESEEGIREGLNAFRKASRLDPSDPELHYYSALCYMSLGQGEEASTALEQALETIVEREASPEDERIITLKEEIITFLNELAGENHG